MSDADNNFSFPGFGKLVPGFDFLQNLTQQAASTATQGIPKLPGLGSWIAPTLNVEELDKRIEELKAVQFWLDQNSMALKATVQALEVQKMTLATLKGMNFNMNEMANAFKLKVPGGAGGESASSDEEDSGSSDAGKETTTFAGLEIPSSTFGMSKPAGNSKKAKPKASASNGESSGDGETGTSASPVAAGVVDPMQWWGALTQQFQAIAADAMKDAAKQSAALNPTKGATDMVKNIADTASKTVADSAKVMNTALRSQAWPTPVAAKKSTSAKSRAKPKAPARKAAARKTAR